MSYLIAGWRRSDDRTRLHANSLLTGNFTGNFAISGLPAPIPERETAVLQPLVEQFPGQNIREKISENRECFADNREFHLQNRKRPFLTHLSL
jgi:hypothetical protein